MNPDEDNQTPEQINPTAHAYNSANSQVRGRKFVAIAAVIGLGVIMMAVIAVIAYNSSGDRTRDRMNQLEEKLNLQEDNPEAPSAD